MRLQLLDVVGAHRVLWSSDYPHIESSFGYDWSSMQAIVDSTSEENARAILGGNAMTPFNLDG